METTAEGRLEPRTDRYFHELAPEEQVRFISETKQEIGNDRASRQSQVPRYAFVMAGALVCQVFLFGHAPLFAGFACIPLLAAAVCFIYLAYLHNRIRVIEEFIISSYAADACISAVGPGPQGRIDIVEALRVSLEQAEREKSKKEHGS